MAVIKALICILLTLLSGCTTLPKTQISFSGKVIDAYRGLSVTSSSAPKSVWIDTDAACSGKRLLLDPDDCWALLYALKSPNLNILGISSVRGNSSSSTALKSITDVIAQVNAGVNLDTLITPHKGAEEKFRPNPDQEPNEAVKALAHMLESERLTIVAIGPLTNIATLIDWRPDLASNIDQIVAVAGQRQSGPLRPKGSLFGYEDLNFQKDLDAFQRVLDADLRITLLPFELAQQMTLERSDLKRLSFENAAARWVSKRSRLWDLTWRLTTKVNGFHPYDLLAVSFVADPTQFQCKRASGKILPIESPPKKREFMIELKESGNVEYCINLRSGFKSSVLDILARESISEAS